MRYILLYCFAPKTDFEMGPFIPADVIYAERRVPIVTGAQTQSIRQN